MSRRMSNYDSPDSPRRGFWDVPSILLAIVVLASPLLIGGVHAASAAAIAATALFGLWWSLVRGDAPSGETGDFALSIPAAGFSFMALVCLIQLIVVPTGVYHILQPTGHGHLAGSWEVVFGEALESGWHLLSVDPRQTTAHGMRWIALAATAALAAQVSLGRRKRRRWLGVILVTGAVVAAIGIAQHLSGTSKILWFYEAQIPARSMSAFVSTNHAATYYALMAIVAMAYSLEYLRRSPLRTTIGAVAAAGGIFLCAIHGSDGALLALAVAVVILAVTVVTRAAPEHDSGRMRMRFATVVTLAVFFMAAIGSTLVPEEWTLSEEESVLDWGSAEIRVHMAGAAMQGTTDYLVVGSGAGSIERSLPPYLDWHYIGPSGIPTVEGEPAEWAMTLGPLATLVALALFLLIVVRTAPHVVRRHGRRGAAIACSVAVFTGIIALFHFPFMTLGISVVAVVALEVCLDPRRDLLYLHGTKKGAYMLAVGLTVALGGLMAARATVLAPGAEEHLQVDDEEEVRRAIRLYPTDGVLLSAISLDARADGDHERALAIARRAFEVRPNPQQEFLLATSLANAEEHEEAAVVYRSLLNGERRRSATLWNWSRDRLRFDLPSAALRAEALADASTREIRRMSRLIDDEEGILTAIDFALELVEKSPDRPEIHLELVRLYRNAGQDELAEMYTRMLIARNLQGDDGERPAGLYFLLDLLRDLDRHSEARGIADRAFDTGHASPELGRAVLRLLPEDFDDEQVEQYLRLFEAAQDVGCRPPYERDHRQLCWEAQAFFAEADDQIERAANYLRRVERLDGDPRPLAKLYARHGRCRELASLRREYEDRGYRRTLREQASRCALVGD